MTGRACPLCGCTDILVCAPHILFREGHVECERCHAKGPEFKLSYEPISREEFENEMDKIIRDWYDEVKGA